MRTLSLLVGLPPGLIWLTGIVPLPTILFALLITPFLWIFIDFVADE
jgi:hypothetical protein